MELMTAITVASAAFNFIKRGIETGKEIEGMSKQLGKWFEAVHAFKVHEKQITKPPLFRKLLFKGSVEQEAMEIVIHRRQIEQQEAELRHLIIMRYGIETYREMLLMRRQIATSRANLVLKRKNAIRNLQLNSLAVVAVGLLISVLWTLIAAILNKQ